MGINFSKKDETIQNLESNIKELKKQNNALINTINMLEASKEEAKKKRTLKLKSPEITKVSQEKIKYYVDNLLKNSDTNISYLPDFVERRIYQNILGISLNLIDDILQTTTVNFLGHQITFDLQENDLPLSDNSNNEDDEDNEDDENKNLKNN